MELESAVRKLQVSTSTSTNNLFLRRMTLDPALSTLPYNTQNVAESLDGVRTENAQYYRRRARRVYRRYYRRPVRRYRRRVRVPARWS